MLGSCSRVKKFDDVERFEEAVNGVRGASTNFPDVDELGKYESIKLSTKKTKYILWEMNSLTLTVEYDSVEFENALNSIDSKYSFLKETKKELLDCTATISGYDIQVVDKAEKIQDGYYYYYPKCFMMVGVNTQAKKIVYLYHYDLDLDYIKDLDDFIDKYYTLR